MSEQHYFITQYEKKNAYKIIADLDRKSLDSSLSYEFCDNESVDTFICNKIPEPYNKTYTIESEKSSNGIENKKNLEVFDCEDISLDEKVVFIGNNEGLFIHSPLWEEVQLSNKKIDKVIFDEYSNILLYRSGNTLTLSLYDHTLFDLKVIKDISNKAQDFFYDKIKKRVVFTEIFNDNCIYLCTTIIIFEGTEIKFEYLDPLYTGVLIDNLFILPDVYIFFSVEWFNFISPYTSKTSRFIQTFDFIIPFYYTGIEFIDVKGKDIFPVSYLGRTNFLVVYDRLGFFVDEYGRSSYIHKSFVWTSKVLECMIIDYTVISKILKGGFKYLDENKCWIVILSVEGVEIWDILGVNLIFYKRIKGVKLLKECEYPLFYKDGNILTLST